MTMIEGKDDLRSTIEQSQRLHAIGVERLTLQQMRETAVEFGRQLRDGIEKRPSSLATIPTLLRQVNREEIPVGKNALVVEMGGTNIYGAIVTIDGEHVPQIQQNVQIPLAKKQYANPSEFFTEVAKAIDPLLVVEPDGLGVIWSFPANVRKIGNTIDVDSHEQLPKEIVIPGISARPIGQQLVENLPGISSDIPLAVANDTAAVLLGSGGNLGGIVGTGFNFAFSHDGQIYNLEAGGFDGVIQTSLTQAIDATSNRQGKYLAEKQISGEYVDKLLRYASSQLGIELPLETQIPVMNMIFNGEAISHVNPDDAHILVELAEIIRDRSAQNVAAIIAGTVDEFPKDFQEESLEIPIEGSFFAKTPGYQEAVNTYVQQLLPNREVKVFPVEHSGKKGAAVAALTLLDK